MRLHTISPLRLASRAIGLALLVASAPACSTLSAAWYSRPAGQFYYYNQQLEQATARLQAGPVQMEIWSASGDYRVLFGPPLVPCLDAEPPILNQSPILLRWRITPPREKGAFLSLRLPQASRRLHLSDGRSLLPHTITTYVYKNESPYATIDDNLNADVEFIEINQDTRLEMSYFGIYYADYDWYALKGELMRTGPDGDGQESIQIPEVRFEPRRDYSYKAFEIPFAYPPPR